MQKKVLQGTSGLYKKEKNTLRLSANAVLNNLSSTEVHIGATTRRVAPKSITL